ncbi:MAG TPA: serine/threonine-protein kinase, partial [Candidatus Paceibacterota bacterium]|nr:serine/threonine-protein kinase [Candidatus Paceibacterota bacterium]
MAVELADPAKRLAFLDEACAGDHGIRAIVEEMLAEQNNVEKLFGADSASEPTASGLSQVLNGMAGAGERGQTVFSAWEEPGQQIGPYKLLERIGEGGCGVVYMAEQTQPVRRCVALKLIRPGMDTRSVIARFELERQALALMDHPNIARVLDAGATELGRPYVVMELVRGIKITSYCDEERLPPHQRLDLFIQVCHAIQHAHQKGIIHRDIKPSNILITTVDGKPLPKVIDFGIAKATGGQMLTDNTVFTALQQFIGTPAYMSPEQAELNGLDVDTRSDIYSLGVLLYELLTGKTPFEQKELLESGLDA